MLLQPEETGAAGHIPGWAPAPMQRIWLQGGPLSLRNYDSADAVGNATTQIRCHMSLKTVRRQHSSHGVEVLHWSVNSLTRDYARRA